MVEHLVRVPATQDRVEEEPGEHRIAEPCRGHVGVAVRGGILRCEVEDDPDVRSRRGGTDARNGQPVGEHQVVARGNRLLPVADPGRMKPEAVAEERRAPRLVQRHPVVDAVTERPGHDPGVLREPDGRLAGGPSPLVLELLRQVPVEERREGLDARLEQRVDEPPVEVEAGLVHGPAAARLDARPREREAVGGQAELAHQRHVLAETVVVVDGEVAGVAVRRPVRAPWRRCPRSSRRDRPPTPRPRSGTRTSRLPTRSRPENASSARHHGADLLRTASTGASSLRCHATSSFATAFSAPRHRRFLLAESGPAGPGIRSSFHATQRSRALNSPASVSNGSRCGKARASARRR